MNKKAIVFGSTLLMLFSCAAGNPIPSSDAASFLDAEAKAREAIVQSMRDMSSIIWTPKTDITYYTSDENKVYKAGEKYVGLPYTMGNGRTVTMGDPLGKFKEKLGEDGKTYIGPTGSNEYYGSDCSSSVEGAWRLNGFDTGAIYTGAMIPEQNKSIYAVGDYDVSDTGKATESICASNGEKRMHASYALLKPGDAIVRRVPDGNGFAGHVRLVVSVDALNGSLIVIEQCGYGIDNQTQTTWRVDRSYTFSSLFANRYIPITPFR